MKHVFMIIGLAGLAFAITCIEYFYHREEGKRFADWWNFTGKTIFFVLWLGALLVYAYLALNRTPVTQ